MNQIQIDEANVHIVEMKDIIEATVLIVSNFIM